jgi:uncharacterized membrane protein
MKDFSFKDVLELMRKTAPFLIFRFLIYFAITLCFVLITGAGAGVGYGIGYIANAAPAGGMWGGLVGFGIASVIMYLIREYLLYIVKAGHVAVLVSLLEGKEIPGGKRQVDYARQVVQERFATSSLLFAVDQLIKGVLKTFNKAFMSVATIIPIPGSKGLIGFVNTMLTLSLTYLDEVILAYLIKTRAENPWAASRTAIILYAQNYTKFLKNAVWLAIFVWVLTFIIFLLVLGPAALLVKLFPGTGGPLTLIVALVFAWGIKQAVIEPVAMIALMQVFFRVTVGQTADPEWEARLESLSMKFNELKQKAQKAQKEQSAQSGVSQEESPS